MAAGAAVLSAPDLLRPPATISIPLLRLSLVGGCNPSRLRPVPRRIRPLSSSSFSASVFRRIPISSLASSPSIAESDDAGDVSESDLTLRQICDGHVPEQVLRRLEEIGFIFPTDVQEQALPVLFSGKDCILHAQTGSGKTLTYLLPIYSVINPKRSAVQAVIVVPTRELGMQVTKVARMLTVKSEDLESKQKTCTVMALLDGGMLKRQRVWLKAEPPTLVVATLPSLCQMLEKHVFNLNAVKVLVVDEVDSIFSSASQVSLLRKLLTTYSSSNTRQTLFASASIPQHRRFMHDCMKQKWTKDNVVHVHVNPIEPIPTRIQHRYRTCPKDQSEQTLISLLQSDAPKSAIIFVNEQSEKSKNTCDMPTSTAVLDVLKNSLEKYVSIVLLDEDMNFNSRAVSLADVRLKESFLIVATDLAARGLDLPETTHIYNYDLPKSAIHYLHRAGRTGRKPFAKSECIVTSIIVPGERFVLERFENELRFNAKELVL
ncbi:DEAD-box ATP-dependent RNA helicase 58, chloroplastic-like protein [Drosera capensis]